MLNSEKIGILESALAYQDYSPEDRKKNDCLIMFATFVAVGFAAAYLDQYIISKLERKRK
jgi:hypothetical protein